MPVIQGTFPNGRKRAIELSPHTLTLGGATGQPLPDDILRKLEYVFRADLADIRIHSGPQAGRIGAAAFTCGTDIYFANGRYQPHTPTGERLLAREVAHAIQQREGRVANPYPHALAIVEDDSLEAEAEQMARRVVSAHVPSVTDDCLRQRKTPAQGVAVKHQSEILNAPFLQPAGPPARKRRSDDQLRKKPSRREHPPP